MKNRVLRAAARSFAGLGLAAMLALPAQAIPLLTGLGGTSDYGELAMPANDDLSSPLLNLPFSVNFFGTSFDTFYINNNGNISFLSPLQNYTPDPFPVAHQPMIAAWWADVDTRGPAGDLPHNAVFMAAPNSNTVVVTWSQVGYFAERTEKRNDFQLVLRNRSETGAGNFDFDFRYNKLEWTTGEASDGVDGLNGIPAQAGYDNGLGTNFQTLPGSLTSAVLNLVNTSNVSTATPGLWTFAVRNGQTPGDSPSNPLLPVVHPDGYHFSFNVQPAQRIFIDPDVAIGYDYTLSDADSPSFASVLLPDIGDGLFDLYLWQSGSWVDSGIVLHAGIEFDFGVGGVRGFSIRGIEAEAGLDPSDTSAFVTGLTFVSAGNVNMIQSPITVSVPVPEPASVALLIAGLLGLAAWGRTGSRKRTTGSC